MGQDQALYFQVNIHNDSEKCFADDHRARNKTELELKTKGSIFESGILITKALISSTRASANKKASAKRWCDAEPTLGTPPFPSLLLNIQDPHADSLFLPLTHWTLCSISWGIGWVLVQLCTLMSEGLGKSLIVAVTDPCVPPIPILKP